MLFKCNIFARLYCQTLYEINANSNPLSVDIFKTLSFYHVMLLCMQDLLTITVGSKFILSVSNFARQRLNSFKVLALVSLFVKVFHAIAPLKRMDFLIKFVSGLGRMPMFSFVLRPEFLCKNKSLNSVTVQHFKHLKTNSVNRTLYIVSKLSHPVRIKTSSTLVSHRY